MRNKCVANHVMKRDGKYYYVRHIPKDLTQHYSIQRLCFSLKTNADAVYADKDAQQFYDYATMKLGIPARNVKELVNDKADLGEIGLAVQDWIARSTKKDKSDIYLFCRIWTCH